MNATFRTPTPRFGIRLTGATMAALITFGVVSVLSQALHVERLGAGAQTVELERVTIVAQRPAASPAVAVIATPTRAN